MKNEDREIKVAEEMQFPNGNSECIGSSEGAAGKGGERGGAELRQRTKCKNENEVMKCNALCSHWNMTGNTFAATCGT